MSLTVAVPGPFHGGVYQFPQIHLQNKMGRKELISKKLKKGTSQLTSSRHKTEHADFLPLEGGPGERISGKSTPVDNTTRVVYIGRIPHGFYEEEMRGFFAQFGDVRRLKIARNKKTGRSKHYGFIEFDSAEVAKVVAGEMNNYKLMEHLLQVELVPQERVHPSLWKGVQRGGRVINWTDIERKRHNSEKTVEQQKKLIEKIVKRDKKRRQKIQAAGLDYECPEFVGNLQHTAKKTRFVEEDD